jgi:hypothetical protein
VGLLRRLRRERTPLPVVTRQRIRSYDRSVLRLGAAGGFALWVVGTALAYAEGGPVSPLGIAVLGGVIALSLALAALLTGLIRRAQGIDEGDSPRTGVAPSAGRRPRGRGGSRHRRGE